MPTDLAAAHAMILAERRARLEAQAAASSTEAVIAHLKLMIEKLRRELYGMLCNARIDDIVFGL
jgi:transposase